MKRFVLYIFIAFTLLSCGGTEGRFRLVGEFEHLRQGEFYIYSNDGGTKRLDTLRLELGEFEYETDLDGEATYYLLYPNFSEQVIFGASGDVVKVKGDARNLKRVEVTGSQPNDEMTRFRLSHIGKSAKEVRQAAADFIKNQPASPVSVFLFKQYFLLDTNTEETELIALYQQLCQAQPEDLHLLQWQSDVESLTKRLAVGDTLPEFRLMMKDSAEVKSSDFKGKNLLINFWASWESESSAAMFRIKRIRRDNPGKIEFVSISLDVNKTSLKNIERIDSVVWPSYCDLMGWGSPALKQFYVPSIPYYILVGEDNRIKAVGSSYNDEILPEINKIIDK
jgi:hypothetical protein